MPIRLALVGVEIEGNRCPAGSNWGMDARARELGIGLRKRRGGCLKSKVQLRPLNLQGCVKPVHKVHRCVKPVPP